MIQHPLTLDALRVLDAIARRGSFAAAADELHRVTSAVSYTVQKLEEDLGIPLFDRSGQRAKLTAAGQLLIERGHELLMAASQLASDARAVASGWEPQLTIALDVVYPEELLIPLVARFYAEHPCPDGSDSSSCPVGTITDIRISGEVLGGAWDSRWIACLSCWSPRPLTRYSASRNRSPRAKTTAPSSSPTPRASAHRAVCGSANASRA